MTAFYCPTPSPMQVPADGIDLQMMPRVTGPPAVLAAAAMLLIVPQLVAWQSIYGQPIVMAQGEGVMPWTEPAVVSAPSRSGTGSSAGRLLSSWRWRRSGVCGSARWHAGVVAEHLNADAGDGCTSRYRSASR